MRGQNRALWCAMGFWTAVSATRHHEKSEVEPEMVSMDTPLAEATGKPDAESPTELRRAPTGSTAGASDGEQGGANYAGPPAPNSLPNEAVPDAAPLPADIDLTCTNAEPYDDTPFAVFGDPDKVYLHTAVLESPMYNAMGYVKFLRVFGIPLIATQAVADDRLIHGAKVFAQVLDSNKDGIPDDLPTLENMRALHTTVGYAADADESEIMWSEKFKLPAAAAFRKHFACAIHFFEQWADDQSATFHTVRREIVARATQDAKSQEERLAALEAVFRKNSDECAALRQATFDWPLIYFPFTAVYYGALERLEPDVKARVAQFAAQAVAAGKFDGVPDDLDMEIADFIVWSNVTDLGALQCFCGQEEFQVWGLCTPDDLQRWSPKWVDLLRTLPGVPTSMPTGEYATPAVATPPIA